MVRESITEKEIKLARQGAMSAWKAGRGIVPLDDLHQEACMWILEHPRKVDEWRAEGRHGENRVRYACKMHALTVVSKERVRRTGAHASDLTFYSPQMVREILPDIFNTDDWVLASHQQETSDYVKSTIKPSEGNNRLALLVDVKSAFYALKEHDQALLRDLYEDGGVSLGVLAATMEVNERTVRRRERRAIDRMVEYLGGEVPFWVQRQRRDVTADYV